MMPFSPQHDLREWLAALREDRLTEEQTQCLKDRLHEDVEARRIYARYSVLQACMELDWGQLHSLPLVTAPAAVNESGLSHPVGASLLRKVTHSPLLTSLSGPAFAGGSARTRTLVWSLALLVNCLLVFVLALFVSPDLRHRVWPGIRDVADGRSHGVSAVARLVAQSDCLWQQDDYSGATHRVATHRTGESLTAETLRLARGLAELEFADGARVVLRGPCEFELLTAGSCALRSGELVARVPRQAIGFRVQTPVLELLDLGTEFGVAVDEKNATEVIVFRGEVEVKPEARGNSSAPPAIRLTAGQSSRVSGQGVVSRAYSVDAGKAGSANPLSSRLYELKSNRRPVLVSQGKPVTATDHLDAGSMEVFPPENIVDGRMNDTGEPGDWSFWLANDGSQAAELTIDLESVCPVVAIWLQNTHNRSINDRGARSVRLSLSVDGKSYSPAGEIELPNAAGQEQIEMQNVNLPEPTKARYVKVECTAWYGFGPGLNEVQVFALPQEVPASRPLHKGSINSTSRPKLNGEIVSPGNHVR